MLEMTNIKKHFPGVKALDNVSLKAEPGRVLALIGINGAGKSTLMNILGGLVKEDSGEIKIEGEQVSINSPKDAEKSGISFIHQELLYFYSMTVAENIFITNLFKSKVPGLVNKKTAAQEAVKYLKLLGAENISPLSSMEDIPIGERQMVEIARALAVGAKIIIFDEPTSSLSLHEKQSLFKVIRNLRNEGKTVIYISHFLDEIEEVCDDFMVLRDGKMSGTGKVADVEKSDLVRMIIGQNIVQEQKEKRSFENSEVILQVDNIQRGQLLKGVSFEIHKGEILGLWGLMGSGRTETVRAMFGLDKIDAGDVYFDLGNGLEKIHKQKLLEESGYITESRHNDGLFLDMNIWQNCTSSTLGRFSSRIAQFMNTKSEVSSTEKLIQEVNIKVPNAYALASELSGGNQQKVIFAKWMNKNAKLLVLDEPTRGVDVGSKMEIYKIIKRLAEEGTSILVISSEIEEMLELSDRAIVLQDGKIVASVEDDITKDKLMNLVFQERNC